MRVVRLLALSLVALCSVARADIDLTPKVRTTSFGAATSGWLQYVDGEIKWATNLDSDAQVSAADGGTVIRFGNIPRAKMTVKRSPLTANVLFDAEGLVHYQKAAVQMLPPGVQNLKQDETVANAETINNGNSYRFTFTYDIAGERMRESIIFLNLDARQQIVVHTGAFLKDFAGAAARATNFIRSWHQTTAAEETGVN
jgi:hypothetical protein